MCVLNLLIIIELDLLGFNFLQQLQHIGIALGFHKMNRFVNAPRHTPDVNSLVTIRREMIKYLNLNLVKPCCEWQVCILYNMSVQATIANGKNLNAKSSIVKWKGMDSVGN